MLNRHGADQWVPATLVACPVVAACAWLASSGEPGWWLPCGITLIAWAGFCAFFRDPPRRPDPADPGAWLSPADGRVSGIERHAQHAATDGPALVIRIFLSVLDVHVNRVPWDGEVVARVHRPGQYLDARDASGAAVNESLLVGLRTAGGTRWGVRLVAGAIARRIVCTAHVGDRVRRGDRMGLIKFGSTTELIVPDALGAPLVRVGDRVIGGVTPLVRSEDQVV
jgi:phosphatidylserine decarboxylase